MTGPFKDMPSHGIAFDTWAGIVNPAYDEEGFCYIPEHASIGIHAGPLFGALGVLIGAPWLVNPVLGALSVLAIHGLAKETHGPGVARLAALSTDALKTIEAFHRKEPLLEGIPKRELKERVFRFAALFARLRGTITMSYGAWQGEATDLAENGSENPLYEKRSKRLRRSDDVQNP